MNKSVKKKVKKEIVEEKRPVEIKFENLDNEFLGNKVLYAIFLLLAFFGIMGLVWMIPFPQLEFLQKMNAQTFLNWGSFYIAIIVYFYLKMSPTLSYAMLFLIGIMSFLIVQLEYVQRDGGPTVVMVCGLITMVGLLSLWMLGNRERSFSPNQFWNLLTIGPIWLWSKLFEKLKIKY